jgi:hypothetical protein
MFNKLLLLFVLALPICGMGQRDTGKLSIDTTYAGVDSLGKKDTLLIKYIPVLPKTYQKADAWYISSLHTEIVDTSFNVFKDYKNYYAQLKNAFTLFYPSAIKSNGGQVIYKIEQRYAIADKDLLFYLILILLFIYGAINKIYPQYFPKLFSQFSQSSLRMLQNREQLLQNSFASLIINITFIISFSLISTLLIFNKHLLPISFWEGFSYITLFFTALYLGKYICLELAGYIFNTREMVSTYVFVVFMINKVLGILLVPFVLILAFAKPLWHPYAVAGAALVAVLLILYRYLFSLTSVRNKLHISSFHFFLYLCAFEILPLLILYRFIVQYFGGTY